MIANDWQLMAASYALDALDADEREAFEARMTSDPELAQLVASLRLASTALADDLDPIEPSVALRERALARMLSTSRTPHDDASPTSSSSVTPLSPGPGNLQRSSILPWSIAAALAAISIGLGVSRQRAVESRVVAESSREAVEMQLAEVEADLAQLDSLLAPLRDADLRFATLTQADDAPSMRLFWSPSRGQLVFAVNSLPAAAPGRTYQLWGIPEGGTPVSLGTFDTGVDGRALELRDVPSAQSFAVSAVTEEPAGGSGQPTSTPFLVGEWVADP